MIFPFERTGVGHKYFPCAEISPCPRCLGPSNVPTLAIAFPLPCLHMISRIFFFYSRFIFTVLSCATSFRDLSLRKTSPTRSHHQMSPRRVRSGDPVLPERERERENGGKRKDKTTKWRETMMRLPHSMPPPPQKAQQGGAGGWKERGRRCLTHSPASQPMVFGGGVRRKKLLHPSRLPQLLRTRTVSAKGRCCCCYLFLLSSLCSSFLFLCCGDGGRHVTVSAFFPTFPPPTDPLGKKGGLKFGLGVCCF